MIKKLTFLFWFIPVICFAGTNGYIEGASQKIALAGTDFTINSNVISWWFFEDAATSSLDGSDNNNDLSWNGNVAQDATNYIQGNSSVNIDAAIDANEYLSCTDASLAPSTFPGKSTTGAQNEFSIGCWVRLDAAPAADMHIIGKWDLAGGQMSYRIFYDQSADDFAVEWSEVGWGNVVNLPATVGATAEIWTLVVATFDGNVGVNLYVGEDGDAAVSAYQTADATLAVFRGTAALVSGRRAFNADLLAGSVDECFTMSDLLTESEINEILVNGFASDR